tara:strand:+ start:46130 stop:46897 length:768 start_codon:yes stop_codon:yes gene_type:complete
MLIAQLSDTHYLTDGRKLGGEFDTGKAFDALIDSIKRQPVQPDLILFSGDLGERATAAEYADLGRALRQFGIPVRAVPGNHDARGPMLAELPDMVKSTQSGHLCLLETGFDLAIIGLDTSVEGQPHGALCAQRLGWLEQTLKDLGDIPVLIFMHHPPIKTGLQAMDDMGLIEGRAELREILAQHGKIQAILCGHMHRTIQGCFAGISVRVAPSSSHQIAFDIRPDQPYRLVGEPGQFMMHLWDCENGLISHTVPV